MGNLPKIKLGWLVILILLVLALFAWWARCQPPPKPEQVKTQQSP